MQTKTFEEYKIPSKQTFIKSCELSKDPVFIPQLLDIIYDFEQNKSIDGLKISYYVEKLTEIAYRINVEKQIFNGTNLTDNLNYILLLINFRYYLESLLNLNK
jgi:hypothetical protein